MLRGTQFPILTLWPFDLIHMCGVIRTPLVGSTKGKISRFLPRWTKKGCERENPGLATELQPQPSKLGAVGFETITVGKKNREGRLRPTPPGFAPGLVALPQHGGLWDGGRGRGSGIGPHTRHREGQVGQRGRRYETRESGSVLWGGTWIFETQAKNNCSALTNFFLQSLHSAKARRSIPRSNTTEYGPVCCQKKHVQCTIVPWNFCDDGD